MRSFYKWRYPKWFYQPKKKNIEEAKKKKKKIEVNIIEDI